MKLKISFLVLGSLLSSQLMAVSKRERAKTTREATPDQNAFQDYMSSAVVVTDDQRERADEINLKTIKSIEDLLRDTKLLEARKFELLLRLGELYLERQEFLRKKENAEFESSYAAWQKTKKGSEPKYSEKRSKDEMLKAVSAFRKLVEKFPHHPRTDAALYSLGKTLARIDNENCLLYFKQIIKNHPKSPLIPETYLAMGEFEFDRHKIAPALEAYKEAIKFKEAKTYPYAVYKLGWAYYNAPATNSAEQDKNVGRTIAAFKLVIKLSPKEEASKIKYNLRQEAINDLVLVWADHEGVNEAWDYFQSIAENKAFYDLLERLGGMYAEKGRNEDAAKAYERLLKEDPLRSSTHQVYSKLVTIHEKMNKFEQVVADLAAMKALYVDKSKWTAANSQNQELITESKQKTGALLHRYGALFHSRGDKAKNDALLQSASKIYLMYLSAFADQEPSYEVRFYLAEILEHFKQYEAASDEYLKVSRQKTAKPKHLKESALAAVENLAVLDQAQKYPPLASPGQVKSPLAIPRVKAKLVVAIDNFVALLPKDVLGEPMRFTAAQAFFDYGHYPEAIKRFEGIALELATKKQGQAAIKVVLGFLNERKDWDQLVKRCRVYAANQNLLRAGMGDLIQLNLKKGVYQQALVFEQAKKYAEAAQVFVAFQGEFPKDDNADRSLFNAAVNYYKIGEVEAAIDVSNKLLAQYPKSKLAPDVMVDVAGTWEAQAQFSEAAGMYKDFSEKFPKDARAPQALLNSALLYRGLSKPESAVQLLNRFAKEYPKHTGYGDALWEKADLAEQAKNFPLALSSYGELMKRDHKELNKKYLSWARLTQIKLTQGPKKEGEQELLKIRRELSRKDAPSVPAARALVAKMLFNQIEGDYLKFKQAKLTSAEKIEKEAEVKQGLLVKLAKKYEEVVDLGAGELTVASLLRLGEVHEQFASELLNLQPAGTEAEINAFKSEIEKAALPLRDQGKTFFETAYLRAKEVESFSEWTKKAYEKMHDLDPKKYPLVAEIGAGPGYLTHKLTWEPALGPLAQE